MGFWEKYEELCEENGIKPSSERMVAITGVSSAAITGWKKGAKPKFDVVSKLADFFKVDERYLLDMTDSRHGEDIIEEAIDRLTDAGVDINSFDDDDGIGQEYVLTYKGRSFNYMEKGFKEICTKLMSEIHNAGIITTIKFVNKTFDRDNIWETPAVYGLSQEEQDLIDKYRKLDQDGKIMLQSTLISELRRI